MDLLNAARLFARGPRGVATTGTGAEMSPNGTLTEHLVIALNMVCGRFCREGEVAPFPRVLSAASARKAQVLPPKPLWGRGLYRRACASSRSSAGRDAGRGGGG